ncbi:MAG: alcohol dehydrogenase catalytic domain-containing protein [Corallococcus sp.]|nr:alcohol dehydrogenase catalytic domain-containing protein [Corallococcus sp.]
MKSWSLASPKQLFKINDDPTVLTEENNVKVKIEQVLFSMSDYNVYDGTDKKKYPFVPGRNAVGVVSEVRQGDKVMLTKMDRVVIEPYIPCNNCAFCEDGNYERCENMKELGENSNGFMQNFIDLPAAILHKLPDALSNERALFTSYVALGLNIVDSLDVEAGRHIAIFASTKVGIIVAQLLAYYQALPILISDNQELLDLAKSQGIFYTFNTESEYDVEKKIQIITGGRMCKEIVYFTNSSFNVRDIYNIAAFNANICISGYGNKESKLSVSQIANKHLSIFGVYTGCGNFSSAINLLVTGKVNVDGMIGSKIPFETLNEELEKINVEDLEIRSKIIVVD